MFTLFEVEQENRRLILSYGWMLALTLVLYLVMVTFKEEGYRPQVYRQAYLYFSVFQFILFSVLAPLWSVSEGDPGQYVRNYWGLLVFILAGLPLLLVIVFIGRLMPGWLMLPLLLQLAWGAALISLKDLLLALNVNRMTRSLFMTLFIFTVIVLAALTAYFTIEYTQAVITTVYDKDIPLLFFLNPLLSQVGLLYLQVGGSSQLGFWPYVICVSFWLLASAVCVAASVRVTAKRRGGELGRSG